MTWLYCSEVAVDVGLGFVGVTGYFMLFLLTSAIKPMEASFLGLAGTLYLLGFEQILSGLWAYMYVKETSGGLSDKEKKTLSHTNSLTYLIPKCPSYTPTSSTTNTAESCPRPSKGHPIIIGCAHAESW